LSKEIEAEKEVQNELWFVLITQYRLIN